MASAAMEALERLIEDTARASALGDAAARRGDVKGFQAVEGSCRKGLAAVLAAAHMAVVARSLELSDWADGHDGLMHSGKF